MSAVRSSGARRRRPRSPRARLGLALLRWALFALVVWFVGEALGQALAGADWTHVDVRALPAAAAVVTSALHGVLQIVGLRYTLAALIDPPGWKAVTVAAWVPAVGKYFPGKVGSLVGGVWMLERAGVPVPLAVAALFVRLVLTVAVGLLLASPLGFWLGDDAPEGLILLGGLACVSSLVLLHPAVLGRLAGPLLRRPHIAERLRVPRWGAWLAPVAVFLVNRIVLGLVLWFVALGFGASGASPLTLVSATALASTAGLVAFFAPGGLGVQEGVLLFVLKTPLGESRAAIVIVVFRILETCRDVAMAGAGWALSRPRGSGREPTRGKAA